ncbi:hypothetical protein Ahy_B06g085118 [Arachis hypogaea]|uniref:Uncharacterized protein n=1 Tax=Arachis hypogaea TaxID=3818 RepID=A0A444YTL5_ARAHY|nr:hypothetical protein Ahy_B06g085118 [Arachis hypogaea]
MAHTSSSPSKKTQSVKFQGRFETNYNSEEMFELVVKIRRNQEQRIELSIKNRWKKRRNIIQEKMASKNQAEKIQTKDLKCTTHLLTEKFKNMSEEKKAIVRDLGFGDLMHIPPLRVHHKLLKELENSFKLGKNTLETGYGSFRVRPSTIGAALGLNASRSSHVQEDFHPLYTDGVPVTNHNQQNLPCAPGTNFQDERNKRGKLESTCSEFHHQGHKDYNLKKKKAIDGCLFALMIVYFHLSINKDKKGEERPPQPWIANWTREQMKTKKRKKIREDSDSESESNDEEKEADLRSTEGHYVSSEIIPDVNLGSDDPSSQGHTDQSSVNKPVESMLSLVKESASEPAEENMMVVRVETQSQREALSIVPIQVCLPLSQTTTVPENKEIPVTENEPTPVPEIEPTPEKSPSEKNNEGTTKSTPEPPQKPEESTHTLPPAPSKINPAPEDAAALMMMARTASHVPKKGPMSSFSLGLTDSSQEEAATQKGAATQDGERAKTLETPKLLEQLEDLVEKIASGGVTTKGKSPQIRKESGGESFEKFETPARTNENTGDMKEKCYI